jgi:aminopeptidase-like protein
VKAEYIHQSLGIYLKLIDKIEKQDSLYGEKLENTEYQSGSQKNYFLNRNPNCEVMLSKHGLYPDIGGDLLPGENKRSRLDMILWLLFFCDGSRAIEEISRYINAPLNELNMVATLLEEKGLLSRVSCPQP